MIRILFVCFANLCRSPMADAVMTHLVKSAGLSEQIYIDSAGTHCGFSGEPAYYRTRDILAEHGIESTSLTRRLERIDLSTFDHVLAMDRRNLASIERQYGGGSADIRLFLSYAKQAGRLDFEEVVDPYPDGDYAAAYSTIATGCAALLEALKQELPATD